MSSKVLIHLVNPGIGILQDRKPCVGRGWPAANWILGRAVRAGISEGKILAWASHLSINGLYSRFDEYSDACSLSEPEYSFEIRLSLLSLRLRLARNPSVKQQYWVKIKLLLELGVEP